MNKLKKIPSYILITIIFSSVARAAYWALQEKQYAVAIYFTALAIIVLAFLPTVIKDH